MHVECIPPTMMLSLQPPMNGFDDLRGKKLLKMF